MPKTLLPTSRPWLTPVLAAAALLAGLALAACGGNSSVSTSVNTPPQNTAMVTTVGDTPMDNVLSAQATISAVNAISESGQSVSLLAAPRVVSLSALGGVREPLALNQVPEGTYSGVTITVTAARVTYLDTSNQVQEAVAVLAGGGSSASTTYNFTAPFDVDDNHGVDLRLDFNLAQSFDLTGSTVTFTPSVTAAVAKINGDSADDLYVRAAGIVTAISSSSITLTMFDSGASITFAINSQTDFDGNASPGTIQVGAAVYVRGTIQSGGTYLATEINACDQGEKYGDQFNAAGAGHVLAVTQANGQLSSFQLVTFTNFAAGQIGRTVTVNVNSSTQYAFSHHAQKAGVTAFDATQIFPGQVVAYAGSSTDNGATVTALGVQLRPQDLHGSLASAISGSGANLSFGLQPNALSVFEQLTHALAVTIQTSSETRFGGSLDAAGLPAITVNSALETRGYVEQSAGADTQFATRIAVSN